MPTDPFVAEQLADEPRQQPNLAPGVRLPAARDWRADRPGDLRDGVQPRGALFGSPGPNIGYASHLVHRVSDDLVRSPHEHPDDVEAVVAELAMKRAASFGRAPVPADIEVAARVLGYLGSPDGRFVDWRAEVIEGASHEYEVRRAVCDAVAIEELRLAPAALTARVSDIHQRLRASA